MGNLLLAFFGGILVMLLFGYACLCIADAIDLQKAIKTNREERRKLLWGESLNNK